MRRYFYVVANNSQKDAWTCFSCDTGFFGRDEVIDHFNKNIEVSNWVIQNWKEMSKEEYEIFNNEKEE